jgi:hypothetical protein
MIRLVSSALLALLFAEPDVPEAIDLSQVRWMQCRAEATVEGLPRTYWAQAIGLTPDEPPMEEGWAAHLAETHGLKASDLSRSECRRFPTFEEAEAWSHREPGESPVQTDYPPIPDMIPVVRAVGG